MRGRSSCSPICRRENGATGRKAVDALGIEDPWLLPLDAASDDDLDAVFAKVGADFGRLDVLVHSIAFADKDYLKEGQFTETPRDVFTQACDINAFTKMPWRRGNR